MAETQEKKSRLSKLERLEKELAEAKAAAEERAAKRKEAVKLQLDAAKERAEKANTRVAELEAEYQELVS